ncbi:uncharacterized protein LOC110943648 [Helianthus annuus]|uniref:uncharacterized protein LOC110943648 n=1 Tax=Helianthus annuus TaxID=4232 RepID=UPI000B907F07|nr:uncharacterized protein LOC110943648 [Helianthus annuus]
MNVMSINIRGLGGIEKGPWIRGLRVANEVGFIMIQETQFCSLEGVNVGTFWGNGSFGFEWVGATGRTGGLLSMWDTKKFEMTLVEKNRYFLMVHGTLKESRKEVVLINVYAPQKVVDKRILWTELERRIVNDQRFWIVGGDFNCVRDRAERRNSKFLPSVSYEFNEFIDKVGLHEFQLKGRKFTFVSGNKCSRIDRIFVSWNGLNEWTNAEYRALGREKSDHSPLVLKVEARNYGAKPFRFFNSWLSKEGFEEIVVNAAKEYSGSGPPDVKLMGKFRKIRQAIVEWRKKVTTIEQEEELQLKQDLIELDSFIEDRDLTEAEQWVFDEAHKKLREIETGKAKDIRQKSRVKWAKEGDENTAFFHGMINKRKTCNNIPGLMIDDAWVFKPSEVKKHTLRFFKDRFVEDMCIRPKLVCHDLKCLTELEAVELVKPFNVNEIKEAIFDCGSDKAPDPDGFNFRFVKRFWDLFADDFVEIMSYFVVPPYNAYVLLRGTAL